MVRSISDCWKSGKVGNFSAVLERTHIEIRILGVPARCKYAEFWRCFGANSYRDSDVGGARKLEQCAFFDAQLFAKFRSKSQVILRNFAKLHNEFR